MAAADSDKYNKLKEKYNVLKEAARKEVKEKDELCARLEKQLKEKETTLRQQLEEIDSLNFQNGRLSKQLGQLTAQVEEQQKQRQQSGWSVQGLISGNQHQEALQKAQDEVGILQNELMMKISENEDLYRQMSDAQRQREEEEQQLRDSHAAACGELEQKSSDLEAERAQKDGLLAESREKSEHIHSLEGQLSESNALASKLRSSLHDERCGAARELRGLREQLARWVPFDEAQHSAWSRWDARPARGREAQRRSQAVQQLQASILEACKQSCGVLQSWSKTFGGGGDEETAPRLKIRSKMAESAQQLAVILVEAVPELLVPTPSRPVDEWQKHFKTTAGGFLQIHRRWVTYQSMLLLDDVRGTLASRSTQEEMLAQAFVDCLWKLHRCMKSLLSKLSLLVCMPALLTRSCSSAHFVLARSSLRKQGSVDGWRPPVGKEAIEPSPGATSSRAAPPQGGQLTQPAPTALMERLRAKLQDALQYWEGIGKCLSAWATQQAGGPDASGQDSRSVAELLESIKKLCSFTAERILPTLESTILDVLPSRGVPSPLAEPGSATALSKSAQAVTGAHLASASAGSYLGCAATRLARAPAGIGFEEATQTHRTARQLSAARARLAAELRQQVKRLQAVSEEKSALTEELRALQDSHALLRSNFQVMQETIGRAEVDSDEAWKAPAGGGHATGATTLLPASENPSGSPSSPGDLVLSSRQRALLDSLSVTAQESASLRQHGFFVDVVSLSAAEVALASGPPGVEAFECWEVAVRKVYEQHMRVMQAQVRAADSKAVELHLSMQQNLDFLKEQEEAKQTLRDQVSSKHQQLNGVLEDIATTRKNYDAQLAMLTEHICGLSQKISEKDAGLASLHQQRVLCGHCGTWNAMGKLLSPEAGGMCQTCKEKVLSKG